MSSEALNLVRSHRFGSASRKVLMYCLADYTDGAWSTFVGQKRLAGETELGERTVRRLLLGLERDGLIRRERRYSARSKGGRTQDHIILVPPRIQTLPASVAAKSLRPPAPGLPATGARVTGQSLAGHESTVNLTDPRAHAPRGGDPVPVGAVLRELVGVAS
ncbi:MAG: helix-turn-helix domain-containing protein [Chloroflexi bacterium]|nr:helix-turn-helix domain-containing protein [Chloroflexota bacterium]